MTTDQADGRHDAMVQAFRVAEATMGGVLGVRASRFDGSNEVRWRDDDVAPAASTIKVFLLIAALERVAAGTARLHDEVELRAEDQVTGSGVLKVMTPGRPYTLRDLLTLMIIVSDNTATNLVLDVVGLDFLRSAVGRHGWSGTTATGKLQTSPAPVPSTTTARDLHDAVRRLWRGELLPPKETAFACDVLRRQQLTAILGRDMGFDPYASEVGESDLAIASKGGAIRGVRNEVGVVQRGGDGFVLAVTTRDCPDLRFHPDNAGAACVSRVAGVLFDHYLGAREAVSSGGKDGNA